MSTSGGECSSCGILVRDEGSQKWQCLRGYHGLRTNFPGRGLEQEDFWWCCQCLLKFRGARAETTPCKVCVLRSDTGAAKEIVAEKLSMEEQRALGEEMKMKLKLNVEIEKIRENIMVALGNIKSLTENQKQVEAAIKELRELSQELDHKAMQTKIAEIETKLKEIIPAKESKTDSKEGDEAEDKTAKDPNKKREDLIQTWQAWINSQHVENEYKERLEDGKKQYTLKQQNIESEIAEIREKLEKGAAGSKPGGVRPSRSRKRKGAVAEEDMEEDEDENNDDIMSEASADD